MEDGHVVIARAVQAVRFPARFSLVGATNPCPCGHLTDSRATCTCNPADVQRYRAKISGPLVDRIDMHVEVPRVDYQKLVEGRPAEIIDTPGMHSLLPSSDDERVARRILLDGGTDVVVHVVDAKNLARMLPITLQLLEVGRPLVIALNMMDEAERLGLRIARSELANRLGVAVVPVVAVSERGIPELRAAIAAAGTGRAPVPLPPVYGNGVGSALRTLRDRLRGVYPVDPAVWAALALQGDAEAVTALARAEPDGGQLILATARDLAAQLGV